MSEVKEEPVPAPLPNKKVPVTQIVLEDNPNLIQRLVRYLVGFSVKVQIVDVPPTDPRYDQIQ